MSTNAPQLQAEQITLLLRNMYSSLWPAIVVALALAYTLEPAHGKFTVLCWAIAVISSKTFATWDAQRLLAQPILPAQVPALVRRLLLLNAIDGIAWGALAWVGLDPQAAPASVLVIAVLSGIVGNSMSLLSPVLPVFVVFCVGELGMLALKAWTMGELAYQALSVAALAYLGSLLSQGYNSARATRAAIELRFENIDLIEMLKVESARASDARVAAEQANHAKSRFLAAASHDLRQPIHAQSLFLEVLARSALTPEQQEILGNARAAGLASAEMLHTLLDFSRIEAGVVDPQPEAFQLQTLLTKIESELAPQANAKGLLYRTRDSTVALYSDPALLELILRNLVSNAVRYTERGGILVACRRRRDHALLEVWDTGIGIAAEQQENIFLEFHQLGNPERDRQKGLGLGLSIARGLAQLLGHPLSVVSQPGRGSVFRLRIPLAQQAPLHRHVRKRPQERPTLGLRVLVIDDDQAVRSAMQHLLAQWGCLCMVAEDLDSALELSAQVPPDIIISDYRLRAQRTGAEAIATLRAQLGRELPALLVTGDTAPVRLREARASGVPLLHKPVAPDQLYAALAELANHDAAQH
ncbi:hybrid sensor histidine kinase/response regulator [Pseudoduganella danionis]|uniref:histidine kinase n=1 Tax=Pseudoduganella danionis TaxID=1890295 RepID=A0ABW9SRU2_9BURK|nr:hybrid sensor histidine kinase/response regulator [Pseudoduganella danionis]MTW33074.1 response regulator [Pseudoduganella danionis]